MSAPGTTREEYLADVAESPFFRDCHTPGCEERFEPIHATQYHCSSECAYKCLVGRAG